MFYFLQEICPCSVLTREAIMLLLSLYFWSTRIALHDSKIKIILIYLTLYLTEALNKSHLGFFNTKPTDWLPLTIRRVWTVVLSQVCAAEITIFQISAVANPAQPRERNCRNQSVWNSMKYELLPWDEYLHIHCLLDPVSSRLLKEHLPLINASS